MKSWEVLTQISTYGLWIFFSFSWCKTYPSLNRSFRMEDYCLAAIYRSRTGQEALLGTKRPSDQRVCRNLDKTSAPVGVTRIACSNLNPKRSLKYIPGSKAMTIPACKRSVL